MSKRPVSELEIELFKKACKTNGISYSSKPQKNIKATFDNGYNKVTIYSNLKVVQNDKK